MGDTGNGLLSAIGMVQALYHRDRTGEGQFLDTSIIYAHLLNTSMSWVTPDGATSGARPSLDAMQLGWGALYGLYETSDGWLCVAATSDEEWSGLIDVIGRPELATDARFADADARRANDAALRDGLQSTFVERSAAEWFGALDAAGVPCEVSDPDFVFGLFDDPAMKQRGWVADYQQGIVGRMEVGGLGFDLHGSPGVIQGATPLVGEHTSELLADLGYNSSEIEQLLESKAALQHT